MKKTPALFSLICAGIAAFAVSSCASTKNSLGESNSKELKIVLEGNATTGYSWEYTLTNEALMYNGVALQSGTSHYFGQKFSEAYGIKFTNKENKEEYAYQTSWGTTTRMIGGLIMVHSDDYGLVLPPKIAPKQVAIIPIGNDEEVLNLCIEYKEKLNKEGIEAYVDLTDK